MCESFFFMCACSSLPDAVPTFGELAITIAKKNAFARLRPALLEVGEGGAARRGVAELLALV